MQPLQNSLSPLDIGDVIYLRRVERRLRQADMARRMGVSQQNYAKFEQLNKEIHLSTLYRIARALGCAVRDLIPEDWPDGAGLS